MVELRHSNRQLLLLRRQADGSEHLGVRNKDRRHQLLHVVATGAFDEGPDLVLNSVLIPSPYLLALALE